MNDLFVHVATILLEDQSDVQVLEANRLPSRVVAATPPGPVLDLMRQTGRRVPVADHSKESVFAAAKKFFEEVAYEDPDFLRTHSISPDSTQFINSIVRGSTYVRPVGLQVGFGFPICKIPDGTAEGAIPTLLEVPPILEPGQPRVWARYHLILSSEPPKDPTDFTAQEIEHARQAPSIPSHQSRDAMLIEKGDDDGFDILDWFDRLDEKSKSERDAIMSKRSFRFTRMTSSAPWDAENEEVRGDILAAVAMQMKDDPSIKDSNIPAGYSFFGQFLTHELTHDGTAGLPLEDFQQASSIEQLRSPSLDLDSIYGRIDTETEQGLDSRIFMGEGQVKMRVSHDLPRRGVGFGYAAIIPEERNDSNLGVAQMHVAFLKLHNRIVKQWPDAGLGPVQEEMRRNIQAVALYDFAKRICHPTIYQASIAEGGGFTPQYWDPKSNFPGMPVEFSAGAFRLGHSMLANDYAWNDYFQGGAESSKLNLREMMALTGPGGLAGEESLKEEYAIEWNRFFDFGGQATDFVQMARKIDPFAASAMHELPGQIARFGSLPKLNLWRGFKLRLPTGQVIAEKMGVENILSADQMQNQDALGAVLKTHGFDEQTPLWLYILREAQLQGDGNHLGELGSKIVLDTLGVLIQKTPGSILQDRTWKSIIDDKPATELQMVDLLTWRPNQPR